MGGCLHGITEGVPATRTPKRVWRRYTTSLVGSADLISNMATTDGHDMLKKTLVSFHKQVALITSSVVPTSPLGISTAKGL